MGPVKMLNEIVRGIMKQNASSLEIQDEGCALLMCLHQSPYKETHPTHEPTREHNGIQSLRRLTAAMRQWRDSKDLQIFACIACVEVCKDIGPGATSHFLRATGENLMASVFEAMVNFPVEVQIQDNVWKLIIMDATEAKDVALSSGHITARRGIYKGLSRAILVFANTTLDIRHTMAMWQTLKVLIDQLLFGLQDVTFCLVSFALCLQEWPETRKSHYAVRDAAISAILALLRVVQLPGQSPFRTHSHRENIQSRILQCRLGGMGIITTPFQGPETGGDSIMERVLQYCCSQTVVNVARHGIPNLCRLLDFVGELCRNNMHARLQFVRETNGIAICMLFVRKFILAGRMQVVEHTIDLLKAVCVPSVETQGLRVPEECLLSASLSEFAESSVDKKTTSRYPMLHTRTAQPFEDMNTLPELEACTHLLSFLQVLMGRPEATHHLVETCLAIVYHCCRFNGSGSLVCKKYISDAVAPFVASTADHLDTKMFMFANMLCGEDE